MPIAANILQPLTNAEEWVLESLHGMGLTWGLAIVGLTLLTRFVMLPLIVRQYRSQREMKRHMPELRALQAKYKGGDKQKLQQEMSAYYREHGINPLASVGPMLLQIPVFISLYMLLRHDATNGLFGDGGFLFIPDLTAKPTGGVLVAMLTIYICSQLASSAIATRTMQTSHRGFAMALPVLFAGVIARFPAGLAIYSITTSLWSLGQQITFWRLSAAVPAGTAALAAELEDVAEAGEDSKLERALESSDHKPAPVFGQSHGHNHGSGKANGKAPMSNGGSTALANGSGPKPKPTHSRSKKKKRSRSRR
ncbi:MAG: YidC/Oxa1 family membrane protein insertase [Solirubrobacterales bacterium]|nr:YidC/Oxa1 family membrane protein insertase [Solirubrobacterales bacterium]MCB8969949.1 YidC/Oxa1 family membrane protein insertase [Thermoleophilales bacterium]MCO5328278.1 YidC/Oxa1 family membrane protein insertase [Solirubrobacterales bacterium]